MDKFEIVNIARAINKVSIPKSIIDKKDWIKYFVVPNWRSKVIQEHIIVGDIGTKIGTVVEKHVNAYIFDKKEPPAEIAGAIMNISDDVLNGREPVLRAGDYISIQNYAKGKQK